MIAAARRIYPEEKDWQRIEPLEGDFRNHVFSQGTRYNLVILSNFLHAYARETAYDLLSKAVSLTDPDGVLLIHDYFPDRSGTRPHKGAMYDLNMMINTFDGACQPSETLMGWLRKAGMANCVALDLESDSSIILASRHKEVISFIRSEKRDGLSLDRWIGEAMRIGFAQARIIPVGWIHTAAWSREKCRFGCKGYGKNHMCPPGGIDHATMTTLLKAYAWALLVVDTPPGKTFHDKLLALEKKLFLAGHHKALSFGAGPCPVCPTCAADTDCRHPELARPSMEGAGIDVYATAHDAGIPLEPVTVVGRYVKYLGMVLIK